MLTYLNPKTTLKFLILPLVFALSGSIKAQEVVRMLDGKTYDQIIDIVFPMHFGNGSLEYGYLIRVKPSFNEEYLVKIIALDGKILVTEYKSLNGNLFYFLSNIVEKEGIEDPAKLAQRVKIKEETKVFSNVKFAALRKQFAQKMFLVSNKESNRIPNSKSGEKVANVMLHGTTYEIKYLSPNNEMLTFEVYDYPIEAKKFNSQLTLWIKSVGLFYSK